MATYGGNNIFGSAVTMATSDNPRSKQLNTFFGLNGVESLDGGARGRTTQVTGILSWDSAAGLAALESSFRKYNDGVARMLVDNLGNVWTNVRLDSFQPTGRIRATAQGLFFRAYSARFLHLA